MQVTCFCQARLCPYPRTKNFHLLRTALQSSPSCLSYQPSKQLPLFPSPSPHLLIILCLPGRGQDCTLSLQEEENTSKSRAKSSGKQVSTLTQNCYCFLFPQSQSLSQQQQHLPPRFQTPTASKSCVLCLQFKLTLNKSSEKKYNTQGGLIKDLHKKNLNLRNMHK